MILKNKKKSNAVRKSNINYLEIYQKIVTNIEFADFSDELKVLNITSTQAGEGKSTVSLNLAAVFASKYNRVLLIDCDLRKPVLHRRLKVSNQKGISNLLKDYSERTNVFDYCHKVTGKNTEGLLYVMTSGSKVPNPQALLGSNKFKELIKEVKKEFDLIIIDCPPVGIVSDASYVSNISDGTIFVVSSKDTNKEDAKQALTTLQRNGAKVLGSVLTKTDVETKSYGYY